MKIAEIHELPVKMGTFEGRVTAKITSMSMKTDRIDFSDYEWIFKIGNPKETCKALRALAVSIENLPNSK